MRRRVCPKVHTTKKKKEIITEYIPCPCPGKSTIIPQFGLEKCREIDLDYTVSKLKELISDPVTNDDTPRISQLLYDYEEALSHSAYMVNHLPAVIAICEFLATKAETVKEYRKHLDWMLDFCSRPPLLEKSSQSLVCLDIMERYFTLLGYLLTTLDKNREIPKVQEALRSLLIRTTPTCPSAVKAQICRLAMEKSDLALVVSKLLNASTPEAYPCHLDLIFLISSVSTVCSHKMLQAGILNTLLIRLDRPYATQVFCKPPPAYEPLEGNEYSDETLFLTMNILWTLTRSILAPGGTPVRLEGLRKPTQCALWGLRYGLKRRIQKSFNCKFSTSIRNDMATLILAFLQIFPRTIMISCGIAREVFSILIGCVSGTIHVWSKEIKFGASKENFIFLKTLLLIVSNLAEVQACKHLLIEKNVLQSILQLIDLKFENRNLMWSPSQFWNLFETALCTITELVPKMPEQFVDIGGTHKLMSLLNWCLTKDFDTQFTMSCTKTICFIAMTKNLVLLNDFREKLMPSKSLQLIGRILDIKVLTMDLQRILTMLLTIVEKIVESEPYMQLLCDDHNVRFITILLERCLYWQDDDFQMDQRLLLAIGSYIWQCIVQYPSHLSSLLEMGTIYTLLDVIEIACPPVRCLFLGILTDICEDTFCGPYLCTWRGVNKNKGFMSLLAQVWRDEESEIGVKKRSDGPIEDVELPQMGTTQWLTTYHSLLIHDISPTMIDMIGSARAKVYSLRMIIEDYGEHYKMAKNHYKILIDELPIEDRVTMSCVDHYLRLKLGEAWFEISKYLAHVGVTPLGMDGQVMLLMTKRHRSWGLFIQERQEKLQHMARNAEEIEEKDEFARIRDSLLAPTFDAFDELEYIRRTSDRLYMLKMKDIQNTKVNAYLNIPLDLESVQYHRTYQDNVNVTAVLDQHLFFGEKIMTVSDLDITEVSPVSSVMSTVTINSSMYDANFPDDGCCMDMKYCDYPMHGRVRKRHVLIKSHIRLLEDEEDPHTTDTR